MLLTTALREYEASARVSGRRPRGLARYLTLLRDLLTDLGEHATEADVTTERIARYIAERRQRSWSPKTTMLFLSAIRDFCRFLVRRGLLTSNPTSAIDWPRSVRRAPRPLRREELKTLQRILDDAPEDTVKRRRHERDRLAIQLMLYGGLRISEVAALRWRDVDLGAGVLTVREGKGGKDRSIPLCKPLWAALRATRRAHAGDDDAVVARMDGRPLTYKSLDHLFRRWLPRHGLNISAHRLRHTFATELFRHGADLAEVQELLGHTSPETTRIYLLVDAERLRCAVDRLPAEW